MRRTAALVVTSCLVALVRPAVAEEAPPPTCETVTTVRCSGSAAPLAVRPAPTPVAAPEPLPPVPDPAPCCAEQPAERLLLPRHGARLRYDEMGQLVEERVTRTSVAGVWAPGLVLWIGSYLGTAIGGIRDGRSYAAVPIFGGIGAGFVGIFDGGMGRAFGYTAGSVLQVGGLVMFVAGLVGRKHVERMPVQVSAFGAQGGGGATVYGRF